MSSLTRSLQRQIIRNRAEAEAAPKRAKLRAKRKKLTDGLPIERNVVLFKKAWNEYHCPSIEVKNKDKGGNITTVKKRKPIKNKKHFLNGKQLFPRMKYGKLAERFRKNKEDKRVDSEAKNKKAKSKSNKEIKE